MPNPVTTPSQPLPVRRLIVATKSAALYESITSLIEPGPTVRFQCTWTQTLSKSLELLQHPGADVVLLDLELEDGKALETVYALVELAVAPVVVLSKAESKNLARRCVAGGALDFLEQADLSTPILRRALGFAMSHYRANNLRLRLEHSEKLSALGQLTAGVAHEINNPATYILSNLQQIEEVVQRLTAGEGKPGDLELVSEMTKECRDGVNLIASISRELKSYARGENAAFESVDLRELIANTSSMTLNEIRYRARFEQQVGDNLPPIVGSRAKLSQVLVNLLINAAHSIKQGSSNDNLIEVTCDREEDNVVIRVSDTGCGIPESERNDIFDAYYTTKKHGLGTGLGLAISRDIATLHKGSLDVESTVGTGTTFTLTLPVHTSLVAPTVDPPTKAKLPTTTTKGRQRVLLIDDEPLLLKSLARMLRSHHDVVTAIGGAAGIASLAEQEFDVIICDVMMPEVDGLHVYEALKESYPELLSKLAYLSGGVFTDRMSEFLGTTQPRILDKPVTRDELLSAIAALSSPT